MTGQAILIIDDDPCSRKLARDVLSHVGYAIREAANAEDGLALAYSERPRLVLMDVQLPGMSGVDALGRLRADPVTAGIPGHRGHGARDEVGPRAVGRRRLRRVSREAARRAQARRRGGRG